jgi:uncharacterized membrane protein (DUF485 family)
MKISDRFLYFAHGFVPYGATEKQTLSKLIEVGISLGLVLSVLTFIISFILGSVFL